MTRYLVDIVETGLADRLLMSMNYTLNVAADISVSNSIIILDPVERVVEVEN